MAKNIINIAEVYNNMGIIKSLHIEGLKKFVQFDADFNEHMNIIVGENESGKSTILDAISIVVNQKYQTVDKSILKDLFNVLQVEKFNNGPSYANLPYIYIELVLDLDSKEKNSEYFWGENNISKNQSFGLVFECRVNEDLRDSIDESIKNGKIPYEYYLMKWSTFAGLPYYQIKKPFNFLYINTSNSGTNASFNYYNRALFNSTYDESTKMNAKNAFRDNLSEAFQKIGLKDIDAKRKFGINDKKVTLDSIISVYEDSISIENRGSGMESLIKTKIAIDKSKSQLDVILIEEPENHLCFTNMNKMIQEISLQKSNSQIIISTHSSMIATKLNLKNILWIQENRTISLKEVDDKIADFFIRADDNSFLKFLLSNKVILVEGATEYLILPKIYKMINESTIDEDGISIVSCNGISYKNYLHIAIGQIKKIAVLTDNDANEERINEANEYNQSNDKSHIFMGETTSDWTWEVCFYNLNQSYFDTLVTPNDKFDYKYHGQDYGRTLGKMLNNKVLTAYKMDENDDEFVIPRYIEEAMKWIKQ